MKKHDTVKLKAEINHQCPEGRDDNDTATLLHVGQGGECFLDRDLHGCRYWNISDLDPVSAN